MKKVTLLLLLIITSLILGTSSYTKDKERDWKIGRVLDTEADTFTTYGGTTTQAKADGYGNVTATTDRSTWKHRQEAVAIEGDDFIYVISCVVSFRWTKKSRLTVNKPVKYAIDNDTFFIIDDENKEHKFKVVKKIFKDNKLRNPQPPVQADDSPKAVINAESNGALSPVIVKSNPVGADIIVDGKYMGSTQSTLRLTPGEHVIVIEKSGYQIWRRTMVIGGGSDVSIDATLEKLP